MRASRRACRAARAVCEPCCRACLDSALAGGNACPGFGTVGVRPCHLSVCGDGRVTGDEACDDGNAAAGDGCEPDCRIAGG